MENRLRATFLTGEGEGEWMVDFIEYMDVLTCHHLSLGTCHTFFKVMLLIRQVCTLWLLSIIAVVSNEK